MLSTGIAHNFRVHEVGAMLVPRRPAMIIISSSAARYPERGIISPCCSLWP